MGELSRSPVSPLMMIRDLILSSYVGIFLWVIGNSPLQRRGRTRTGSERFVLQFQVKMGKMKLNQNTLSHTPTHPPASSTKPEVSKRNTLAMKASSIAIRNNAFASGAAVYQERNFDQICVKLEPPRPLYAITTEGCHLEHFLDLDHKNVVQNQICHLCNIVSTCFHFLLVVPDRDLMSNVRARFNLCFVFKMP